MDLYVAGSAGGGTAGWACEIVYPDGTTLEREGTEPGGTGPRTELRATVEGLAAVGDGRRAVRVHTTSKHLVQTAESWIATWRSHGWRKKGGTIANLDLVQQLARAIERHELTWVYEDPPSDNLKRAKESARLAREACPVPEPAAAATGAPAGAVAPSDRRIVIYTDGGCRGNPGGVGGWACLLLDVPSGRSLERRGAADDTTNNRMEMMGAIEGLRAVKGEGVPVELRSDSKYLIDVCTKWIPGWKRNGWRKKDGEPVKNLDLVQDLEALVAKHRVKWTWVPGHCGEAGNEYVDALLNRSMDERKAGRTGEEERRFEHAPVRITPG